jgi:hypothetical protein
MSVKSDLLELERSRKRETAIREVLRNMQGGSNEGLAPEEKENGKENGKETSKLTAGDATEPGISELPPYTASTSPARVVDASPAQPWMRNGKQWRPMFKRELEAVEMARFDKAMLKQWADHGLKEQRSYDEKLLLDAKQAKRMAREKRTGLRRLPGDKRADEEFISMEEAGRRGLL